MLIQSALLQFGSPLISSEPQSHVEPQRYYGNPQIYVELSSRELAGTLQSAPCCEPANTRELWPLVATSARVVIDGIPSDSSQCMIVSLGQGRFRHPDCCLWVFPVLRVECALCMYLISELPVVSPLQQTSTSRLSQPHGRAFLLCLPRECSALGSVCLDWR